MIEQLTGQSGPLALVLGLASTSSLVSLPGSTRPIKNPDQLDVELHKVKDTPHDVLLDRVRSWFLGSDEFHLLWRQIVESPSWLVDCDTERSSMLFEVVGGQLRERDKFTPSNDIPQAIDAHDWLLSDATPHYWVSPNVNVTAIEHL